MDKVKTAGKRWVLDNSYFDTTDKDVWEKMYDDIMEPKYKKNKRKFKRIIHGSKENDNIYVVGRVRAGPSYKNVKLLGVNNDNVQYCLASKGYNMQELSSFSVGPIVGEGICLVNAAFSKCIAIAHIEGGGVVDYKRVNYWKRSKKPLRKVTRVENGVINIDDKKYNVYEWLANNEELWYKEWLKWAKSIALCSRGDFHWTSGMYETIAYHNNFRSNKREYLNFVNWKKQCYILPSYKLLPDIDAFKFMQELHDKNIPIALVHPKGYKGELDHPLTKQILTTLFNNPEVMACQPYVVVARLLGVEVN